MNRLSYFGFTVRNDESIAGDTANMGRRFAARNPRLILGDNQIIRDWGADGSADVGQPYRPHA